MIYLIPKINLGRKKKYLCLKIYIAIVIYMNNDTDNRNNFRTFNNFGEETNMQTKKVVDKKQCDIWILRKQFITKKNG